jgi:signal transduction histidine kinase
MEIRKSACSLQDIAADVVEEMRAMLTQARLECSVSASPAAQGLSVHADPARIRQVVHNLLGNALKFTPAGGSIAVEIDCGSARGLGNDDAHWDQVTQDDAGAESHVAILRVRDNGCGIPEGELDLIFDKFAQSSKTKTAASGTGLGLAICREIMAAHEGSIRARNNRAGPGAVFELVLPLVLVPA